MNDNIKTIKLTEESFINLCNLLTLTEVCVEDIKAYDSDSDDTVNVTELLKAVKAGLISQN